MPKSNFALRFAYRFLVIASVMFLMLLAAIQFSPGLGKRIGLVPFGVAKTKTPLPAPETRQAAELNLPADAHGNPPPFEEFSGSATDSQSPAVVEFPEQPTEIQLSSIEIETMGNRGAQASKNLAATFTASLAQLERQLKEMESRQESEHLSRTNQVLEQLQSQTSKIQALREQMESLERQVEVIHARQAEAELNGPEKIVIQEKQLDGRPQVEVAGRDVSLSQLLTRLGELSGQSVMVSPEISGSVSLHITSNDPREALESVCRIHHCRIHQEGAILVIMPVVKKTKSVEKAKLVDPVTKLYHLKHLSGAEIRPYVAALLTPGVGTVNYSSVRERINTSNYRNPPQAIIVIDSSEVVAKVDRLIQELDRPTVDLQNRPYPIPASPPTATIPVLKMSHQGVTPEKPAQLPANGPVLPIPIPPVTPEDPSLPVLDPIDFLPPIER